ncbi:hypothetical protein HOA91_05905 [Candidatus Woesearchaeota archaeon]|jgi:hypothetical protein|nr:hypothetical protein [Candidatus Woesearchaeota archaeon]
MTQLELTDIIAEFTPTVLGSFVAPLAITGFGFATYRLLQKYELLYKSKVAYSQTKDSITDFLEKYRS